MMDRKIFPMMLRWHWPLLCAGLACCGCDGQTQLPNAINPSASADQSAHLVGDFHYPAHVLTQPPTLQPASYTFALPSNPAGSKPYQPRLRSASSVQQNRSGPAGDGFVIHIGEPIQGIARLPATQEQVDPVTNSSPVQISQPAALRVDERSANSSVWAETEAVTEAVTEIISETAGEHVENFVNGEASGLSRWSSIEPVPTRSELQDSQRDLANNENHGLLVRRLPQVPPLEEATVVAPFRDESTTNVSVHQEARESLPPTNQVPLQGKERPPRSDDAPDDTEVEFIPPADPMRAVNERAEAMIRHGFSLAQRGATYSARLELIEAMRIVAEALDLRDGTRRHSDALRRGFKALEEAEDFEQRGLAADLDMAVLVAGHQTPALKGRDLSRVTPLIGLQQYFTYAQEQLAIAGDEQATSSVALYGIGRLEAQMQAGERPASPQAIVFHQAAVMVDGMNYKAANELGVLLARYGQFEQAREFLVHSVRVCPQVESWRNLAKVHERLGEHELARRAAFESQFVGRGGENADESVRWVDAAALAGTIGPTERTQTTPPVREAPAEPAVRNVSRDENQGIMRLIPWIRRSE